MIIGVGMGVGIAGVFTMGLRGVGEGVGVGFGVGVTTAGVVTGLIGETGSPFPMRATARSLSFPDRSTAETAIRLGRFPSGPITLIFF